MTKQIARMWIENNPETGSIKPYELFFQNVTRNVTTKESSSKTMEGALKAMRATMKRNAPYFDFQQ